MPLVHVRPFGPLSSLLLLTAPLTSLQGQWMSRDRITSSAPACASMWPERHTTRFNFRCSSVEPEPLTNGGISYAPGAPAGDHRWEGAIIGASGLGLALLALTAGLCNSDSGTRSCTYPIVVATVTGAVVGGTIGLFIGSAAPKERKDSL